MLRQLLRLSVSSLAPRLLVLLSLAIAFYDAARLPMLEAAVCRRWYSANEPSAIGSDGWVVESMCKVADVQDEVARIYGGETQCSSLLTLLLALPYARLAMRYDRRRLLLCAAFGVVLKYSCFYAICHSTSTAPLRLVWLTPLFNVAGGGEGIMFINLWAILAESTPSNMRSSVFFLVSSILLATQTLGTFFSGVLLARSPWSVAPFALASAAGIEVPLAANLLWESETFYKLGKRSSHIAQRSAYRPLANPTHGPSSPMIKLDRSSSDALLSQDDVTQGQEQTEQAPGPTDGSEDDRLNLLRHLYRDFFTDPAFTLCFLVETLIVLGMSQNLILVQWASQNFHWPLSRSIHLMTFSMAVSGVVLAGLPVVTARLLPLYPSATARDFALMRANLVLRSVGAFAMAVAQRPMVFVPALGVYTLGVGLLDSEKAFLTSFTPQRSITNLYTLQAMLQNLATVVSGRLWPALFIAQTSTDGPWIGLPFWVSGGLFAAALATTTQLNIKAIEIADT